MFWTLPSINEGMSDRLHMRSNFSSKPESVTCFSFPVYHIILFLKLCCFIINHVKNVGLPGINVLLNA